jgi:hypothetical protein
MYKRDLTPVFPSYAHAAQPGKRMCPPYSSLKS